MASSNAQGSAGVVTNLKPHEELVIDGETAVDDMTMAARIADIEISLANENAVSPFTASKQVKTLEEVNAEMSSDSEDETVKDEADTVVTTLENSPNTAASNNTAENNNNANVVTADAKSEIVKIEELTEKQANEKSELDKILALNNLQAVSDDEEELPELQFKFPLELADEISDNMTMLPLGKITSVIGKEIAIVQSDPNSRPIDLNAIVVTKERKVVGMVIDTFGTVKQCMYSIALTEASRRWVTAETEVFAQEDTISYVFDTIHDENALRQLEDELSDDYSDAENSAEKDKEPKGVLMNAPA